MPLLKLRQDNVKFTNYIYDSNMLIINKCIFFGDIKSKTRDLFTNL